jgi:hypothetical protein
MQIILEFDEKRLLIKLLTSVVVQKVVKKGIRKVLEIKYVKKIRNKSLKILDGKYGGVLITYYKNNRGIISAVKYTTPLLIILYKNIKVVKI